MHEHGLCLLWKPVGMNSQACLAEFKRSLGYETKLREKIGHAGTLDPFAEGLLLCGMGEGTKLLSPLFGLKKAYLVSMLFGVTTETLDLGEGAEGEYSEISEDAESKLLDLSFMQNFLQSKVGKQQQLPPKYSALKVNGKRAYDLAREGKEVELQPREVEIYSATPIVCHEYEHKGHKVVKWDFSVEVSSGTYIRSLARDWAEEITAQPGCLETLVRFRMGPWSVQQAFEGPKWLKLADMQELFTLRHIGGDKAVKLRNNGTLPVIDTPEEGENLLILGPREDVLAWYDGSQDKLGRVFRVNPLI